MLVSVAIFENQPYDKVAEHAYRLDNLIRTAELPADKQLKPLKVFTKPKKDLLRQIHATTVLRDHPTHSGLQEETIRFVRQDWADAALHHLWREYMTVQSLVLDWICAKDLLDHFPADCVNALCLVITRIPARYPLQMVDYLAARNAAGQRKLAAWVLVRLADVDGLDQIVADMLDTWAATGSPNRKATAVMTYALRFSESDPRKALDQLVSICRSTTSARVRWTAFHSVLYMLAEASDSRPIVFETLRTWVQASGRDGKADGPRIVGLAVGMWVTGFFPNPEKIYVTATDLAENHADDIGFLAEKVLWDREYGATALNRLFALANTADYDRSMRSQPNLNPSAEPPADSAGDELVRILTLITPDLRWWARRRKVASLCGRHPTRRKQIRWIFKTARTYQRRTH
ncbi:MAG: hypothetical protein ABW224_09180 [Kibdelosporangium sp.]